MKHGEKKHHKAAKTHDDGPSVTDTAPASGAPGYMTAIPEDLLKEAVESVSARKTEAPHSEEIPIEEDGPAPEPAAPTGDSGPQVQALKAEIAELKDRALRAAADLENFRKRALREKEEFQKFAAEGLIRDLLPVADNVDQAMAHLVSADLPTVRTGVEMTFKSFLDALKKKGVAPFEAKGRMFDPNLHEAVQMMPSDDAPAGHIIEEVRRGYMIHDRLLRAAMVIVSTGKAAAAKPADGVDGDGGEGAGENGA